MVQQNSIFGSSLLSSRGLSSFLIVECGFHWHGSEEVELQRSQWAPASLKMLTIGEAGNLFRLGKDLRGSLASREEREEVAGNGLQTGTPTH